MTAQPIVISGMGAVSGLGGSCAELWRALEKGEDGIRPVRRFPTAGLSVDLAALVPGEDEPMADDDRLYRDRLIEFAVRAGEEALRAAGLTRRTGLRCAVVMGTNTILDDEGPELQVEAVARRLGLAGPSFVVATACSASTNAIGLGRDLVARGEADVVLAGGADIIGPDVFASFHALGALSRGKCAPFSEGERGTTLGEGAAFVVLESEASARSRTAEPLAWLCGYGLSDDAFHETSPDPSGAGVARALRASLSDAGVAPAEVGYVNAHGTGTDANDVPEYRAFGAVFGPAVPPVSSSKSFLGHAQGAAGALELVTTVLAMRAGVAPPTQRFAAPRRHGPADPVAAAAPRPLAYDVALSTSSAFAGANAAVVVSRTRRATRPAGREVFVTGAATYRAGDVLPQELDSLDPRKVDPAGQYLCAATALAARDARAKRGGALRDVSGLIVGSSRLSAHTVAEFRQSVAERGKARPSAAAFARRLLGAPGGACTRELGLRGPTSTLATGRGSGLAALAYAAHLLATRPELEQLAAAGVDELLDDGAPGGAACAWLTARGEPGAIRLLASAFGADQDDAVERALAKAALGRGDVAHLELPGLEGAESSGGLFALAAAVAGLRSGAARRALIATGGGTAPCAVLLERT